MAALTQLLPHSCSALYVRITEGSNCIKILIYLRIVNACDPQNFEPNLALNLEITDLINAKKGSA